jgi:hypothetical protein
VRKAILILALGADAAFLATRSWREAASSKVPASLLAAKQLHRDYFGIELDAHYHTIATLRLRA